MFCRVIDGEGNRDTGRTASGTMDSRGDAQVAVQNQLFCACNADGCKIAASDGDGLRLPIDDVRTGDFILPLALW